MENYLQKKPKLNLFALASIASGFYVGYQEGKGVEIGETKEYLLKYGPTALATVFPPAMLKLANYSAKSSLKNLRRGINTGELEVTFGPKVKKKFKDLTAQEKKDVLPRLEVLKERLESRLEEDVHYLEPALTSGTTVAVQTAWGYLAGRFCSQIV